MVRKDVGFFLPPNPQDFQQLFISPDETGFDIFFNSIISKSDTSFPEHDCFFFFFFFLFLFVLFCFVWCLFVLCFGVVRRGEERIGEESMVEERMGR